MQINLTPKEFRRLLDLVYIGNWVLNSTRGEDRFADYDNLESKLFALSPALSEHWNGTVVPSRAYQEGGIHEAIACYEDNVFYEILAEELSRRDMDYPEITDDNYDEISHGWIGICRNLSCPALTNWFWMKKTPKPLTCRFPGTFFYCSPLISASPARKMSPAPMVTTMSPSRTFSRR